MAIISQTFVFKIGASPKVTVNGLTSFSGLDGTAAEIDVTSLSDTSKKYLKGLRDSGTFSLEGNFLGTDAGQNAMRANQALQTIEAFEATLSSGKIITFNGYVMSASISGGVDEKVSTSFTIRIDGAVTIT